MSILVKNMQPNVLSHKRVKNNHLLFKGALDDLKPKDVFKIFEEITQIYKESGHNKEISEYIEKKLKDAQFEVQIKGAESGNGQYTIVATRNFDKKKENADVILQSHMDIVGISVNENGISDSDTTKPIVLERVSEQIHGKKTTLIKNINGEWLKAQNRSLGADNGIGVATMLAIAENPKFKNMPLEMIFTTDEETGMDGAKSLKTEDFYGKYLINFDNVESNHILVGCAGFNMFMEQKEIPMMKIGDNNYKKIVISINGGNGGHSGVQIQENHLNPLKTILSELHDISNKSNIKLASIEGGTKINAIPKDATAVIYVPQEDLSKALETLNKDLNKAKKSHSKTDPNLTVDIHADNSEISADTKVINSEFQDKLLKIVGKQIKSELISTYGRKNINEQSNNKTSQNLAVLKLKDGHFEIEISSRSTDKEEEKKLNNETKAQLSELLDKKNIEVESSPIWQPKFDTPLQKKAAEAYQETLKSKPDFHTCHAGIEPAIFVQKVPDLEQISVGPIIKEPHTENERIQIPSVKPFYNWITLLLDMLQTKK